MSVRYFLGARDRYEYERRAGWRAMSEPSRDGDCHLFNTHACRTTVVRIVEPCPSRDGWIVEVDGEIDPSLRSVLHEEESSAPRTSVEP